MVREVNGGEYIHESARLNVKWLNRVMEVTK